ncbi:MAG: polysaccharide pyruvyl transferase family protein [Hyphomicrobiales bacterium]
MFLRELGFTPINTPHPALAQIMFIGSILDPLNNNFKGIIFGAGFLRPDRIKDIRSAKVIAVRGKLTKKNLGIDYEVLFGDPGLLLPFFIAERPPKRFSLGIVPHYQEKTDKRIHAWALRFGEDACVIDVFSSPTDVFKKICQCEMIISSSLHGIVVADSLGIPNVWMKLSERDEFKYHDYYSAFDEDVAPYYPTREESLHAIEVKKREPPPSVREAQFKLFDEFQGLKKILELEGFSRR